jgi:glycerol-3-phosphate acyltransferase PlsY
MRQRLTPQINRYIIIRKLLHVGAAMIPIFYYVLPRYAYTYMIVLLTIIAIIVELLRFKNIKFRTSFHRIFSPLLWEKEKSGPTGATFFLISATISIFMFSPPVAVAVLLFLAIGDTVAYLVRDLMGKTSIFGKMSPEGVLGSFLVCIPIALWVPNLPLKVGLIGALISSLVEIIPWNIDDNLSIPLITGMVMQLLIWSKPPTL